MCWWGKHTERQGGDKTPRSPLIKFQKMGMMGFFSLIFSVCMLAKMKEVAIFFSSPFLYDRCFIDKEDLLWEVQGKWRGYSKGSQIRLLID